MVTRALDRGMRVPRLAAVRGATTVEVDDPALIDDAVRELLREMVELNEIDPCDILSAIFSATSDLRSRHPAAAARALGWTEVPMLCVAELEIDGMLPRCVRVLLHVSVTGERRMRPVYRRGARCLRPDLTLEESIPLSGR